MHKLILLLLVGLIPTTSYAQEPKTPKVGVLNSSPCIQEVRSLQLDGTEKTVIRIPYTDNGFPNIIAKGSEKFRVVLTDSIGASHIVATEFARIKSSSSASREELNNIAYGMVTIESRTLKNDNGQFVDLFLNNNAAYWDTLSKKSDGVYRPHIATDHFVMIENAGKPNDIFFVFGYRKAACSGAGLQPQPLDPAFLD